MNETWYKFLMYPIHRIFENHYIFSFGRGIFTGFHRAPRRILQDYVEFVNPKSVLDICCGPGDFASVFKEIQYTGLDMSRNYVSALRLKNYEFVYVIMGDALKLPIQKTVFDMCIFINGTHHFDNESLRELLEEAYRVLKLGGTFLCMDAVKGKGGLMQEFLLSIDRGKFFRTSTQLNSMLKKNFLHQNSFYFRNGLWLEWAFLGRRR